LAEKQDHQPVEAGQADLRVVEEAGLTLMAKPSKPGIQAVFTSTSPFASGMAIDRIGGMTTLP
jgi:hypothetical protein